MKNKVLFLDFKYRVGIKKRRARLADSSVR